MREADLERKCCEWAKAHGWLAFKFVSPGRAGVPDRVYLRNGHAVFVDFKAPGKKPTDLQWLLISRIRYAGFSVLVCDDFETFMLTLKYAHKGEED